MAKNDLPPSYNEFDLPPPPYEVVVGGIRYVVTPFKSLATFENYFAISAATSNNSHQDYQKLVWQFKLLLTTVLYYSCFQAFQNYYLPWSTVTPEVHLLTVDLVYFGRLPGRFHLLLSTQSAMVAYLLTLFYFRPNAYLNRLLASVLFWINTLSTSI
ncbi:hypothetical protein TYRP_003664 [Tyrophagus putrescentiae]|nr:hypothetical protein TYRP_003664 [Tyrophagus putrescentiae]